MELHYSAPTPDGLFFISAPLDKLPMLRDAKTGDWCVWMGWLLASHGWLRIAHYSSNNEALNDDVCSMCCCVVCRIGTFQGHKGAVWSAKLNKDATRAATGSADFSVKVWDAIGGGELISLEHGHVVKSVDFSNDGRRLATGCIDKKLRVYSMERLSAVPVTTIACPDRIRKVAWAKDDSCVYTGSEDGAVRAYDPASQTLLAEAQLGAGAISDLEVSQDGGTLTIAAGREVILLSSRTLQVQARHALPFTVEAASLHPINKKRFVAGGTDVHVHLYDVETGAELVTQKGHHGTVHAVRFAPDGESYVSGADDAIIRIWKYEDGKQQPQQQQQSGSSE